MPQPTAYNPAHEFLTDEAANPNFPGSEIDIELNALETTLDEILVNLALIQRDDGGLKNGVVTYDSLSSSLQTNGIAVADPWVTATAYVEHDPVIFASALYRCLVDHTAGTFATDLAAAKWEFITGFPSSGIRLGYDSTTTAADPGAGEFRLNHATPASATAAYLDNTDVNGTTVSTIFDLWDDSTSTVRGSLRVEKVGDSSVWAEWNVTGSVVDSTGYRTLTITGGSGSGTFTAGDAFALNFLRSGDKGDTGATGATGSTGATGATGPGYTATSVSSIAIASSGSKAFTTQASMAYTVGARVRATDAANTANWMEGLVTAYSGTTLTFTADLSSGAGTIASWNINLAGERGAAGAGLANVVDDTTPQLGGQLDVNGQALGDGTLELLKFAETASAVNEITIANAATGNGPAIQATGDDTNIDLVLTPKGTGVIKTGSRIIASAADPGADRVMIWDESANDWVTATLNAGLSITGTTIYSEEVHGIALSDETTAITTGTNKATFSLPYAFTVTSVYATLNTVSSSGTPTVDINEAGTTILSTKLTIDVSEKTSSTAAAAAVISDAAIAADAEIGFDIDTAGTGAKGLKVFIRGYRT
jgi:hypothetical protein